VLGDTSNADMALKQFLRFALLNGLTMSFEGTERRINVSSVIRNV
jgi:hypothetical protein